MRYAFDPEQSVLTIHATSSVHPIQTETAPTGWIEVSLDADRRLDPDSPVGGEIELDLTTLRAGNPLLDKEAERRLHVRRFPTATATLTSLAPSDTPGAFTTTGDLDFHGVTRSLEGTLHLEATPDGLRVEGTIGFDVTDFDVQPPSLLLLKVHADIRVELRATATRSGTG